jgi:hypothetical protein
MSLILFGLCMFVLGRRLPVGMPVAVPLLGAILGFAALLHFGNGVITAFEATANAHPQDKGNILALGLGDLVFGQVVQLALGVPLMAAGTVADRWLVRRQEQRTALSA